MTGVLARRYRGFRVIDIGAAALLLVLVLIVYLAKTGASSERARLARIDRDIAAEQEHIRLLKAEVAHLENPGRLTAFAAQLGLQPLAAQRETQADALPSLMPPPPAPVTVAAPAEPTTTTTPAPAVATTSTTTTGAPAA